MAILKNLIRDIAGIIVPQYLKEDESDFEAVKGKNGALNVNATITGSLANEVNRQTLVADTDTLFTFSSLCKKFDIMNLGVGDIYYRVDAVAEVAGEFSILVPAAMGYSADVQGTVVHVISSGTPIVQIVGVR